MKLSDIYIYPSKGYYGKFGGRFVPETLIPPLRELEEGFFSAIEDKFFLDELDHLLRNYAGRPTPLYYARNLSRKYGFDIFLKREDLLHTGAHKINNTIGQALLAKKMGKKRLIAETGAGQHGVATATAGALLGFEVEIFMGSEDVKRQYPNVLRMKLLGAKIKEVKTGSRTLKDAVNEALREWVRTFQDTHYLLGSVVGPHPFPLIVRYFQSVIGRETLDQFYQIKGDVPDFVIACVGGGSNSAGMFYPFIELGYHVKSSKKRVFLIGVEAGGEGIYTMKHGASLVAGSPGYLHGAYSYVLQNDEGQIIPTHSVSAGLDYPGVGPEHSFWKEEGYVVYDAVKDEEALKAFEELARVEGIIPALESAHALAYLSKLKKKFPEHVNEKTTVVVNLSGRGDKDMESALKLLGYI